MALFPPRRLFALLQARCYTVSAFLRAGDGASVGDSEGTTPSASASAAPAGSIKTRVFWAQRPGAQGSAKLVTRAADVGDLLEEVAKKLKLDAPLDSIKLQLVATDKDGKLVTAKDAHGEPLSVTLNNMDTIDTALRAAMKRPDEPEDKLRIIVDVVAPAAPPRPLAASADGADADAVQRTRVRSCAVLLCRCTA